MGTLSPNPPCPSEEKEQLRGQANLSLSQLKAFSSQMGSWLCMAQRIEGYLGNDMLSVTTPPVLPDKWKRFKSVEINLSPGPQGSSLRPLHKSIRMLNFQQPCVGCTDHRDIIAAEFRCLIFLVFTTFSKRQFKWTGERMRFKLSAYVYLRSFPLPPSSCCPSWSTDKDRLMTKPGQPVEFLGHLSSKCCWDPFIDD